MTNVLDEKDQRDYCPVCKKRTWLGPKTSLYKFELHAGLGGEYPCPGSNVPR